MKISAVSLVEERGTNNIADDIVLLKRCPHIVVGTPERIGLLISRGILRSHDVKCISINKSSPENLV